MRASIVLACLVVVGCGGRIAEPGLDGSADGSGGDGGDSDGGTTCAPRPGCASTMSCNDGCNACTCKEGSWICTMRFCPPPSDCPPDLPAAGSACTREGLTCSSPNRQPVEKCAPMCTCRGGAWACNDNPCALPCPPTPPPTIMGCSGRGHVCRYTGGCPVTCTCEAVTPEGDLWRCESPPC
jgi:hypothetical protein